VIQIQNLTKSYEKKLVLNEINATIQKGTIFALLGPNGSGKTTLIKSILGLTNPDHGSILVNGIGLDKYKLEERSYIGYMPQSPLFPPNLKVKEIINYLIELGGKEPIFLDEIKNELGLDRFWNELFGKLSLGTKQKINILQCFMCDLDIIIIDEPTASLDPGMSYYFKKLLFHNKQKGKTILFTSHIMSEVDELADDMLVLVEGNIVANGNPQIFKETMKAKTLEEGMIAFWKKNEK
jgi:Cu-processing system ATP-binding protein